MAEIVLTPDINSISGRLGNIVFFSRYGKQYARSYVSPANRDTVHQKKNRELFSLAVKSWQSISDHARLKWNRKAAKCGMSGYNLYISSFMINHKREIRTTIPSFRPFTKKRVACTFSSSPLSLRFTPSLKLLTQRYSRGKLNSVCGPPY